MNEHKRIQRECLLESLDLLLNVSPYNVQSSREDANSQHDVLTLEGTADAAALCKLVMRPEAHDHLFRFALHVSQRYKMQSRATEKEESYNDGVQGFAAKEGKGRLKTISELEVVPFYYTQEMGT